MSKRARSKYGNVGTNGFASKKEARRYQELQLLEKAGEIHDLRCQVQYPLIVNNEKVGAYIADFVYVESHDPKCCRLGRVVVEDVKGVRTAVYAMKAKLMKAIHGIIIRET